MIILDNVACGDDYTEAATIENVYASSGGYFSITQNDVFVQLQFGRHGLEEWTDEVRAPVGNGILAAGTLGVRFRNATTGQAAVVSAALAAEAEPPLTIVAGGQASATSPAGSSSVVISTSAAGATVLVAAAAGRAVQLLAAALMAGGSTTVKFQSSGGTDLTGDYTLISSTGFVLGFGGVWTQTPSGEGLQIVLGSAVPVGGVLVYRSVAA